MAAAVAAVEQSFDAESPLSDTWPSYVRSLCCLVLSCFLPPSAFARRNQHRHDHGSQQPPLQAVGSGSVVSRDQPRPLLSSRKGKKAKLPRSRRERATRLRAHSGRANPSVPQADPRRNIPLLHARFDKVPDLPGPRRACAFAFHVAAHMFACLFAFENPSMDYLFSPPLPDRSCSGQDGTVWAPLWWAPACVSAASLHIISKAAI